MFALKSFIGTTLTPTQKIAALRGALLFFVFLFILMLFYRFMDLQLKAGENKVTIATQTEVIKEHKANDKGAGEAAVAINQHRQQAVITEVTRQVQEAKIVTKHQQKLIAKETSEPLYSTSTQPENELSQLRIDWLWDKYCTATNAEVQPCEQ